MNDVKLFGNLARDVMFAKTSTGKSRCSFTVVTNKKFKDTEITDYVPCVAWDQTADYLHEYGKKGVSILVEGTIKTRSYDNTDGKKVYSTEVNSERVELIRRNTEQKPEFDTGKTQVVTPDELPF